MWTSSYGWDSGIHFLFSQPGSFVDLSYLVHSPTLAGTNIFTKREREKAGGPDPSAVSKPQRAYPRPLTFDGIRRRLQRRSRSEWEQTPSIKRPWGGEIVLSERSFNANEPGLTWKRTPSVVGRGKKRSTSESNCRRPARQLTTHSSRVEVSRECRFGAYPPSILNLMEAIGVRPRNGGVQST